MRLSQTEIRIVCSMHSARETAGSIPISADRASSSSKKYAALPKYRYAIRVTAILIAVLGDILLIGAAALTATFVRFQSLSNAITDDLLFVIVPAFLLAAVALDCYRLNTLRRSFASVGRVLLALAIAAGLAFAMAFAFKVGATYSRLVTGVMLGTAAAYLTVGHILYRVCLDHLSGAIDPRVLILGPAVGAIGIAANVDRSIPSEWPNPGDPGSLERTYAQIRHADRIILAFDDPPERAAWAQFVRLIGIDAELIEPDLQNITVLGVSQWEGTPTLVVARGALDFGERVLKRAFDLTISVPLLGLVGPLLLLLMLLIKLESPGPAIFAQLRVGRNNCRYKCYKLRTMYDDIGDPHGNRSTARDDNRITKIGKVLRRTSLDELPQLWNVIRGDMSLVGPRPHAMGSTAEGALFWEVVPDYWTRHAMRPGMTGLAQVRGLRGATTMRSDIEKRVAADLEYVNSWSIWYDLKILLQTIRVVFHRNAF
jgi:exopolysaccharide biosynthesis polyprenyl glycosylphosphotransferase